VKCDWCVCVCSMGVTAEMLRPFLEGWTLKQIIDAKRLFLVDLKILGKIPTKNNRPVGHVLSIVSAFVLDFWLLFTAEYFYNCTVKLHQIFPAC